MQVAVAAAGSIVGFLIPRGIEFLWHLVRADGRAALEEVARLAPIAARVEHAERAVQEIEENRAELIRLTAEIRSGEQKELAALRARNRTLWDALSEGERTGHPVPVAAILARAQLEAQVATGTFPPSG